MRMNSLVFFLSLEKGKEYLIDHVGWLIVLLANMQLQLSVLIIIQREGQQTPFSRPSCFLRGSWW